MATVTLDADSTFPAGVHVLTVDADLTMLDEVAPTITTTVLPSFEVGVSASVPIVAAGTPVITIARTSGALPAGIQLSGNALVGTPTTAGSGSFTIVATNAVGSSLPQTLSWTVGAAIAIATAAALPKMVVDVPYSVTLIATGVPPIYWSAPSINVPAGLSLNALGVLSGTPTTPGPGAFVATASSAGGRATRTMTYEVSAAPVEELVATPATVTLSISSGPLTITIRDASGELLSSLKSLAARAQASKPGYVDPARNFVGGQLRLTPRAVGSGTVTVTYGDQIDEEVTVVIPVTVTL
jgi:hypothetical protein